MTQSRRAALTPEQAAALAQYKVCRGLEDWHLSNVPLLRERTRAAGIACRRLGVSVRHGLRPEDRA